MASNRGKSAEVGVGEFVQLTAVSAVVKAGREEKGVGEERGTPSLREWLTATRLDGPHARLSPTSESFLWSFFNPCL